MAHTDFYLIINSVISRGGYDLSTVLNRIDTLWAEGKIQDDERDMLTTDARDKAAPQFDYSATIQDILARLRALEEKVASGETSGDTGDEYKEYVAGKYYYNGDKILFNGKKYHCIAPSGTVCVWSPVEYPAYWEMDE